MGPIDIYIFLIKPILITCEIYMEIFSLCEINRVNNFAVSVKMVLVFEFLPANTTKKFWLLHTFMSQMSR